MLGNPDGLVQCREQTDPVVVNLCTVTEAVRRKRKQEIWYSNARSFVL